MNKFNIPPYAKIKVYWDDKPENYSRENKNTVRNYFAKKYNISKNNINVVFRPVKVDAQGNTIEISGAAIDNIMDVNYQRALMKEWLKREEKDVDIDRLMKLDDKVNSELDVDFQILNHRSWNLKWMTINNFLCFGENNFVSFSKLNGLNIVTSDPLNQGGKTTFSVDALKFLFFGKTTKTDKNEQVFNQYSENNELVVRGMIEYDDKEVIIERRMTRSKTGKGGWSVKNFFNLYKLLPDGSEENLKEEDAKATTLSIQNTIGSEKDFDITILATERNLEDLIHSTPTESGKLLTKFIGLEVIENKETIARGMYNKFDKTKQSNVYDMVTLIDEITVAKEQIELYDRLLDQQNTALKDVKSDIEKLNNKKDTLLSSKKNIDVLISQLNPDNIQRDLDAITAKGKTFKTQIDGYVKQLEELGEVEYDEMRYNTLTKDVNALSAKQMSNSSEIMRLQKLVDELKNGEFCPTCKRALDDVDHSGEIKQCEDDIDRIKKEIEANNIKIGEINAEIASLNEVKRKVDQKNQIELNKDKAEVEIAALRNSHKVKKADLTKYTDNEEAIKFNINIDAEVSKVKTDITVKENERDALVKKVSTIENTIENNKTKITTNEAIIKKIKSEEEVEKIFKVYIDMIGKKGISKLVLRSVLPIINSELIRLMEDVCDFEIELIINSKNEVEYLLTKDEVEKPLKSGSGFERTVASLALRCVLAKMSYLPMPNFITFDEVLGKVANINIEKMRPMFEKIKDMYDIIFLITHNDIVKDWGDNIITIKKTDNISKFHLK